MLFKHLLIILFLFIDIASANSILNISIEPRFKLFIKKLNLPKDSIKINNKKTALDSFNDIERDKASLAITRGDILVDNHDSNKFKIVTRLKSPTFLYLISKTGINDAYNLLNPSNKDNKKKIISVGYPNDLANLYLRDIAKNISSQYSFKYKFFTPKESLQKLKENKIDSAYLFLSPKYVQKAKKMGFKLQKIVKSKNIFYLSKKLESQKAFKIENSGIRVDNYLIVSSSISKKRLKSIVYSLKKRNLFFTNIKSYIGKVDSRIYTISKEIDKNLEKEIRLREKREKECRDTKKRRVEITSIKKVFYREKKRSLLKIKRVYKIVKDKNIRLSLDNLSKDIERIDKYFGKIVKKVEDKNIVCNLSKTEKYLKSLKLKKSLLLNKRKKIKEIEREISKQKKIREQKKLLKNRKKETIPSIPIIEVEKYNNKAQENKKVKQDIPHHSTISFEREDREF